MCQYFYPANQITERSNAQKPFIYLHFRVLLFYRQKCNNYPVRSHFTLIHLFSVFPHHPSKTNKKTPAGAGV